MSFFEATTQRPAGVLRLGSPEIHPSDEGRQRTLEGLTSEMRPHGLLVVTGDVQYETVARRLDDSQFVEQRRLAAHEIARVFRIPPHMIGAPSADSMTYSNVEQESIEFVRYSLTPWLRRIELALSGDRDLAFQRQFVKFEVDGLLRADAKTRAEVYRLALDPIQGWLSRDEVRRLEDLAPEQTWADPIQATITQIASPQEGTANGNKD
jgi:HK97 family phage portal protein